ncbi:MAG: hypothetical protein ASARMPREDX12_002721 [Alectoria sarmentosa]|nr:MAG: hypothetical protein ASARMPREDX12_002721 [Alectoria sarmentosa]
MKKSRQIAVLALAALVAASPFNCPPAATVTVTLGDGHSTPASSSAPVTSAPHPVSTTGTDGSADYMTISITNVYGSQLSLSFLSNAGAPAPVGNPSATVLPDKSPTQYAFPTGWAGRIYVGSNTDYRSSKIEGSLTGPPDIDVSYVDGYSVPITCSSEGIAVSGCNIDLFKQPALAAPSTANPPHHAEGKSNPKSNDPFANEAKGSETRVKSEIDERLEKRQSSKIGASVYSERDCNGFIGTVDDLTQSPGKTWLPTEDGMAYSFELLYRGLQGQEQLDISTKDSGNGDQCGDFIDSYFAGTSTSCNNWGNIGCVKFWINPGL